MNRALAAIVQLVQSLWGAPELSRAGSDGPALPFSQVQESCPALIRVAH